MNNYGFKKTINDITGQQFGLWTVVKLAPRNKRRDEQWLCRCQCGTERVITTYDLKHGRTKGRIRCAHIEGRAAKPFNAIASLNHAIEIVERINRNGIHLDDVLTRLYEERDKLQKV